MNAYQKNAELQRRLERRGIIATIEQAATLRRAEMTLHRWAELECGDGNDYASWAIERDGCRVNHGYSQAAAFRRVRGMLGGAP